jgi:hypothetical protein
MDQAEHSTDHGTETSRRLFLQATAVSGTLAGFGGVASGRGPSDTRDEGEKSGGDDGTGYVYGSTEYDYTWHAATQDAYWYSLFNLGSTLTFGGNGVRVKDIVSQERVQKRQKKMMEAAGLEQPPVKSPNLVVAPFTTGDPHYTQEPDFEPPVDADTRKWDVSRSSKTVSPASVAWPQTKAVTWAKNFQNHFGALPKTKRQKFRTMKLGTLVQMGIEFALIDGKLRKNEEDMTLVSEFEPETGEVVDETARPNQHAAMLWFLADTTSLAQNGWYGYENPEPIIPGEKIQQLTDQMAKTTMNQFPPERIVEMGSTRDLGEMLGAMGWYGTHAGDQQVKKQAVEYANALADTVESNCAEDGAIENGADNQAATQGIIGQGLLWTSQVDGVDQTEMAESVLGYMLDELWDEEVGTFTTQSGDGTVTITAQDAGDVTGGLNAAEAVLDMDGAQDVFTTYFNNTFNRGRLQRSQLKTALYPSREYVLPLPLEAGGEFGQAPVYNTEVRYDTQADEWQVTDDTFTAGPAIYLANQDIWISNWSGGFFHGRGVPGRTDEPI